MGVGTAFSIGKLVWQGAKAVGGGTLTGMGSVALGTVMFAKKYVDGENHETLHLVQKSEACPNIELVECTLGVPSAYAVSHVAEHGGISWKLPEKDSDLIFWHPDSTFRPVRCSDPLVKDPKTNLVGKASYSGPSKVCENTDKCCRRPR